MKNARTAAVLVPSTRVPTSHGAFQVDGDLVTSARQPTTNAGHACATSSSPQPGRSRQSIGVKRAAAGAAGLGGAGVGGTVWQPAMAMTSAANAARRW